MTDHLLSDSAKKTLSTKAERILWERILKDLRNVGITDETIIKAIRYYNFQDNESLLPISCDVELRHGNSLLSAHLNIEIGFQDGDLNTWAGRAFLYPTFAKHNNKLIPLTDEMKALGYQILIAKPEHFKNATQTVRIDSLCTSSFFEQGYRASAGMTEFGCDCYAQRYLAKIQIHKEGGLSLLTPFSGRGNGSRILSSEIHMQNFAVRNKLAQVPNTYEAHLAQGYPKDKRSQYFWIDGMILSCMFNLKNVKLLTNNPEKVSALKDCGISVMAKQHKDHNNVRYYQGLNAEAKKALGNHAT